jgi:mannose-1-phosphate guanylyltransferase
MRHTLIIAGGSGIRLWPMSRSTEPKQLLPLLQGRSLLELAWDRTASLADDGCRWICASEHLRSRVLELLPDLEDAHFLGEPQGRDTLPALAFSTAIIRRGDPEASIGVFTADHLIEPLEKFREVAAGGYGLAERLPGTIITFGVPPTSPATGFGYLELGEELRAIAGESTGHEPARVVTRFREKPDHATARAFVEAGPGRYLWNSGMFVWRAPTFLEAVHRYQPDTAAAVQCIAAAWDTPERSEVLTRLYPTMRRISVDFAVMEPVSIDRSVGLAAMLLPVQWRDVGTWSAYADSCRSDVHGNSLGVGKSILVDCRGTLTVSTEADHLVTGLGCEDLIIVHTAKATLVCRKDRVEDIKALQERVARELGNDYA